MERLTLDDMIKALRCVASQDTEGDCYADHENFMHMQDDEHKSTNIVQNVSKVYHAIGT